MDRATFEQELRWAVGDGRQGAIRRLANVVELLRPAVASDIGYARIRFGYLVELLEADALLASQIAALLYEVLHGYSFEKLFAESGIVSTRGFWPDLRAKLSRKLLPEYYPEDDARWLLHQLFSHRTDYSWLSALSPTSWQRFMRVLRQADVPHGADGIVGVLSNSLIVLAQRITAIAYEPEIDSKLPELESINSPFLELARATNKLVKARGVASAASDVAHYERLIVGLLGKCQQLIDHIYANKDRYGVSMHFVYLIKRFEQQVARYGLLFNTFRSSDEGRVDDGILQLLVHLIRGEKQRNSIRVQLHTSTRLLLYKIAVNTSKTGEHYKVANLREYFTMLKAALGGGLVVALLACLKLGVSYLPLSPLGSALGYSLNYAVGFVAIYMMRFTLATKQPAMTASTIAKTLADGSSVPLITRQTLVLIRQIARSQLVSLLGNVGAALPFAWLLTIGFAYATGGHMADASKSVSLMDDISLWSSLSVFYAAIAGVYLMLSGLIAGYYDNLILHNSFCLRIRAHRGLLWLLGPRRLSGLAQYLSDNMGNLAGNVALGLFLGATSTLGHFIGLPLDIRHVTFAAANFGIALADYSGLPSLSLVAQVAVGIFCIGLMNVVVSFGLSIAIALYSHGANPADYLKLVKVLVLDFVRSPLQYMLPLRFRRVRR
jgi:site-specific recombinase